MRERSEPFQPVEDVMEKQFPTVLAMLLKELSGLQACGVEEHTIWNRYWKAVDAADRSMPGFRAYCEAEVTDDDILF